MRYTSHFEQPLWFVVLCSLAPFLLLCFLLKEPHGEVSAQLGQPSGPGHAWRDFRGVRHVFGCKTLPQKKLWAVFFAFQVYVFVQQGQERTFVLFLQNYPLYWRSLQIGVFLFVLYTLAGLGSWPGVPLLQRITDDASIAILAMISKLLGSVLLAFAEVDPLVYLGKRQLLVLGYNSPVVYFKLAIRTVVKHKKMHCNEVFATQKKICLISYHLMMKHFL